LASFVPVFKVIHPPSHVIMEHHCKQL